MAFLDNSGDIILDAVLTDIGRKKLADGTFKIAKFGVGDDEIDYNLYDSNHPSGSAYYDLEILQSPVMEAFTDSGAALNSHLVSYSDNNLLYLPVILLNTQISNYSNVDAEYFILANDKTTTDHLEASSGVNATNGLNFYGFDPAGYDTNILTLDQGVDNDSGGFTQTQNLTDSSVGLSALRETSYTVEVDQSLLQVYSDSNAALTPTDSSDEFDQFTVDGSSLNGAGNLIIKGPQGTRVSFKLKPSRCFIRLDRFGNKLLYRYISDDYRRYNRLFIKCSSSLGSKAIRIL